MQRLKTEFTSALADFFESFRAIEDRSSVALRHESEALARQIKLQEQNVEVAKQPRNLLERSLASVGLNRPQDLEIRQDEEFLEKLKKQKAEIDAQLARREEENKAKPPPAGLAEEDKPDRAAAAAQRRAEAEARAAERMREANEKVIAALKRDYEGFDDARQKAIDDALARLNEQATPAQRQAVSDLAAAIYDKREADRQAAEAAREHQKVMDEGTRITEGVRTEAEKYSDTLQHLSDLQQQGAIDAETYRRAVDKANADFVKATKSAEDSKDKLFSFEDALKGMGVAAESSFEKAVAGGQKFSEILQGLAADLEKLALRQAVTQPLMKLLDQGAGIAGDWLKGLFSSSSTPVPSEGSPQAGPGAYAQLPFAHGGVVAGGNVIPFARGGLVDRPTIFPMARGYGLMGEAGPEAVMPLRRLPSGDLGVAAGGAGVTVNVINNAGAQVTTQERKDQRGGLTIDVMIDAVEQAMAQRAARPGTALNRALAAAANPIKAR
jgi:lambda family phage tail tape measure protein